MQVEKRKRKILIDSIQKEVQFESDLKAIHPNFYTITIYSKSNDRRNSYSYKVIYELMVKQNSMGDGKH